MDDINDLFFTLFDNREGDLQMDDTKKRIGKRIAEAIYRRRFLQKEVAERSGIHPSTLSQYIHGKMMPTLDAIQRLAVALRVNPAYLAGWSDNMW